MLVFLRPRPAGELKVGELKVTGELRVTRPLYYSSFSSLSQPFGRPVHNLPADQKSPPQTNIDNQERPPVLFPKITPNHSAEISIGASLGSRFHPAYPNLKPVLAKAQRIGASRRSRIGTETRRPLGRKARQVTSSRVPYVGSFLAISDSRRGIN